MKEKKLKLMKYLLFGVFTCLIGVGFTGCGKDYDDEIKDLQSKLAKVTTDLGLAATTTAMNTAVAGVVDQAKNAAKEEVAKMMGSGVTVEQASKSMGELMALNAYFANDPYFAGATRTLNEVLGEAATKAGTTSVMVEGMKKLATDVAMLKNQMAVLGTVTGTGSNAQSSVIKDIQDRLDAISTGTGGGTPNYDAIAAALAANQAFMNAIIEKIGGDLNMLPVYNMVTEISLVQTAPVSAPANPFALSFGAAVYNGNSYVFGPDGYVNRFEFKDKATISGRNSVVIRVTPANAVLTKEMISLVSSKGESNVGGRVRIIDIQKYDGDITSTRASMATGLYKITMDLSTTAGNLNDVAKDNAFAIAAQVNEGRNVLTDFAIMLNNLGTMSTSPTLDFNVNGTSVDKIAGIEGTSTTERTGANGVILTNLPVKVNQAFEVKMNESRMVGAYAYYIDVEKLNPTDADRSKITGLQKVYRIDETAKLTITDAAMKGTQLKFRVHAVNYDGSEVKYNASVSGGRSFYVMCDKDMAQGVTLNFTASIPSGTILPLTTSNNQLETNELTIPYWTTQTNSLIKYFDMTMTVEGLTFTVTGTYDGTSQIISQTPNGLSNSLVSNRPIGNDLGKIYIKGINPANLKEDITYNGTLTLRDAIQSPLAVYPVTLKKPTPTPPNTLLNSIQTSGVVISSNGPTAYAIGDQTSKLITIIPAPIFGDNILKEVHYTLSQAEMDVLFGNGTPNSSNKVIVEMSNSNGVEFDNGTKLMKLKNGYYNETSRNLTVKYNYGKFGYYSVDPSAVAEDFKVSMSGYTVQYASALAGYELIFAGTGETSFLVSGDVTLSARLTLKPFKGAANSVAFDKAEIEKWIDPAQNSFSGTIKYIDSNGVYQSVNLTHVGYDASNNPKFKMPAADVAKLSTYTQGRACGLTMTLTDRLGAKAVASGNLIIKVDPATGIINVTK